MTHAAATQQGSSDFQREDKTMRAVKLTSSLAAVFTAIALGTAAGHAQELEQVNTVFEHAIPNIAGKSLIARVVTYPQAARHRPIAMPGQPSSTLMCCPVPFAARLTMSLPRSTGSAKAFTRCLARITE